MTTHRNSIDSSQEAVLTNQERKAIMTLALMAVFADGRNDPAERAEVARVVESLSPGADLNVATLYQEVLLKPAPLDQASRALTSRGSKRLA